MFVLQLRRASLHLRLIKRRAAATHRRPLLHLDGDHMTLINVYNAYQQREWPRQTHTDASLVGILMCVCVCPQITKTRSGAGQTSLNASALRLAVVIRAELLEVMQRIELPVSPPAFGCQDNSTNIKRALISGFFLKVNAHYTLTAALRNTAFWLARHWYGLTRDWPIFDVILTFWCLL